jgi:hypothetical protein
MLRRVNFPPQSRGFYRSMKAYEIGLGSGDTRMLLSPDSEFFQYFNSAGGQASGAKPGEHPTTPAEPKPTPEAATPPAAEPRAALEGSGTAPETAATGEAGGESPPAQ